MGTEVDPQRISGREGGKEFSIKVDLVPVYSVATASVT